MGYFLSEFRRAKLIRDLTNITMPQVAATLVASYEDDIAVIDKEMAKHTKSSNVWTAGLKQAQDANDDEQRHMFSLYIVAEIAITKAYRDEVEARGLNGKGNFPQWEEALEESIAYTQIIINQMKSGQPTTIN